MGIQLIAYHIGEWGGGNCNPDSESDASWSIGGDGVNADELPYWGIGGLGLLGLGEA